MKIVEVKSLGIHEIKVIRFARFCDPRGYFVEHFRESDFYQHPDLSGLRGVRFLQANESFSRKGVLRGLHFQWHPRMGKLVRTVRGRLIDLVLDIRKRSPTCGKILAYDMPSRVDAEYGEWIWVPPGFAHGNLFPEDTQAEYFCSAEYNPSSETGISPLAPDIDWSLCEPSLRDLFATLVANGPIMTEKDRQALTLNAWLSDVRSEQLVYDR